MTSRLTGASLIALAACTSAAAQQAGPMPKGYDKFLSDVGGNAPAAASAYLVALDGCQNTKLSNSLHPKRVAIFLGTSGIASKSDKEERGFMLLAVGMLFSSGASKSDKGGVDCQISSDQVQRLNTIAGSAKPGDIQAAEEMLKEMEQEADAKTEPAEPIEVNPKAWYRHTFPDYNVAELRADGTILERVVGGARNRWPIWLGAYITKSTCSSYSHAQIEQNSHRGRDDRSLVFDAKCKTRATTPFEMENWERRLLPNFSANRASASIKFESPLQTMTNFRFGTLKGGDAHKLIEEALVKSTQYMKCGGTLPKLVKVEFWLGSEIPGFDGAMRARFACQP